ncbi:MAG: amidohydrolase family protein, partial [Chloroflexi bacterium]|nr:amidohydrolase family protein [Chloroflexota bacterium]
MPADILLYNGSIQTMQSAQPCVQAMLIRAGRVFACGSTAALVSLAHGAQSIDLDGRTALPGLEDAHVHLCALGQSLSELRLAHCRTLEEALSAVAAACSQGEGWIRGAGWDHNRWPVPIKPSRYDLDRVAPHRPVALASKDLHSLWVNSTALRLAGIDRATPDVQGGEIARDQQGEPLGILSEEACGLVERVIPPPSSADRLAAIRLAISEASSLGLVGVHNCEGTESFSALCELYDQGELPLHVWHMLPVRALDEALALGLRTGFGSQRLRIGHVKMFADGALGSATAEMLAPYEGSVDHYGVATTDTDTLYDRVLAAARGGLASAIHAIGDRANRRVLDVYARVAQACPTQPLR